MLPDNASTSQDSELNSGLTTVHPWEVGRRLFPRWYFHNPEVPFEEQSDGIHGSVRRPNFLFDTQICRIIIKDMSLGGVGFIAPKRYQLPKRVVVLVGDRYQLVCEILHRRQAGRYLTFYGARWYRVSRHDLMVAINHFSYLCRLVS